MIVSYAQNFEDIMLWRALKDVENGFYIDVGANDPVAHSVTKLFYDSGWHGINIEPVEQWHSLLVKDRPRDINLKIAAGDEVRSAEFFGFPDTGLSTLDETVAQRHRTNTNLVMQQQSVDVRPLAEICAHYCPIQIHFLKIDVEGAEGDVLKGMDFKRFRPWILIIESNLPLQASRTKQPWEEALERDAYSFVYYDGLNNFYIANEKYTSLRDHFSAPPNVFDSFKPHELVVSELMHKELEDQYRSLQENTDREIKALVERLDYVSGEFTANKSEKEKLRAEFNLIYHKSLRENGQLRNEVDRLTHSWRKTLADNDSLRMQISALAKRDSESRIQLDAMLGSLSWKVTSPLRRIALLLATRYHELRLQSSRVFDRILRWGMGHSRLVKLVHFFLKPFPGSELALTRRAASAMGETTVNSPPAVWELNDRANRIYAALKTAVETKRDQLQ